MGFISIIVPVYNTDKYLRQCIDSLILQTLKDIEIILVDDGSTDCSGEICDEYASQDERIKVIHKKNQGVAAARNDGFKMARGDYVVFCDSDDMMEKDACKIYNRIAQHHPNADVIIGDVHKIRNGKNTYVSFFAHPFYTEKRENLNKLILADFSRKYCPIPSGDGPAFGYGGPWNKAVKRSFILSNKISFDENLKGIYDDILYTAYLYAYAKGVAYVQSSVYTYREINSSMTHSYKSNILEINEEIFKAWEHFIDIQPEREFFYEAYYALVIRRLKGMLGVYFFNSCNKIPIWKQMNIIKKTLSQEPYKTAIRCANPIKLAYSYDVAIWIMARLNSAFGLWIIYRMRLLILFCQNMVRNKCRIE